MEKLQLIVLINSSKSNINCFTSSMETFVVIFSQAEKTTWKKKPRAKKIRFQKQRLDLSMWLDCINSTPKSSPVKLPLKKCFSSGIITSFP